jgi:hypothetical protein
MSTLIVSTAAWRKAIDEALRRETGGSTTNRPLSDDEWVAVEGGISANDRASPDSIAAIARQVVLWRRVAQADCRQFVGRRRPGQTGIDWTEEATSDVLAAHAEQETEHRFGVKAFRAECLGTHLLTLADVPGWIRSRVNAEKMNRPEPGTNRARPRLLTLAYAGPGSDFMQRVVVAPGGTLERLREIAARLEAFYGWDQAQATTFVLTGMTPIVHAIRGTVSVSSPLTVRSKITLTISPSCTPREVADYYRRVRRQNFGRIRRLGERHARLAAFAAQLPPDLSLSEQMRRWNAQCASWRRPTWRFQHPSRFTTEAQRAVHRLVDLHG